MVKLTVALLVLICAMVAIPGLSTAHAEATGSRAVGLSQAAQTPTPTPADRTVQPVSPRVIGALICISLLSLVSLAGSFAFKRYFDRLNAD
jgi:hypothetical protein